ncbi:MAG: 50S ribosomal protein L10 [Pseudomonadota bacterium]
MNAQQREMKAAEVAAIRAQFERASAVVLLDFRGVGVPEITELRVRFRDAGVHYKVVKNNLVRRALADTELAGATELDAHLKGPTAIAWSFDDPSAAAKIVKAFRKQGEAHQKLSVKCGLLDTELLSAKRVEEELATLPGKDELRAQLLAQLLAPTQSLVRQLAAPAQNLAYALSARETQLGESQPGE